MIMAMVLKEETSKWGVLPRNKKATEAKMTP